MTKRRQPPAPTITATSVDPVTTDYHDGIDGRRRIRISSKLTKAQHTAAVAAFRQLSQAHNDAEAWTFDGLVRPGETYWLAQPAQADPEPLSKASYRQDILRQIAWLRRIVREGLSPSMTVENAIVWAVGLGIALEDARWRFSRGDDVRKARKVRASQHRATSSAAQQKREASERDNAAFYDAVALHVRHHPADSPGRIAQALFDKHRRKTNDRRRDLEALRQRIVRAVRRTPRK